MFNCHSGYTQSAAGIHNETAVLCCSCTHSSCCAPPAAALERLWALE